MDPARTAEPVPEYTGFTPVPVFRLLDNQTTLSTKDETMPRNSAPSKKKTNSAPSKKIKIVNQPVVKQDNALSDLVLRQPIDPKPIEDQPPALPVQVIERRIETVMVEIPLGEPPRQFQNIHIGEALVYGEHAQTWARLRQGLRDKDARTADGKDVRSGPDIIRWLMEKFAASR